MALTNLVDREPNGEILCTKLLDLSSILLDDTNDKSTVVFFIVRIWVFQFHPKMDNILHTGFRNPT